MSAARDRLLALLGSATLNGIDYVEVREAEPDRLRVHFHNAVPVAAPGLVATLAGGEVVREIPVAPIAAADWGEDDAGRPVLALRVPGRGDFSTYRLRLDGSPALDRRFREVDFSFFAFCPSPLDCRRPEEPAPEDPAPPVRLDYLAKDHDSFRRMLSDLSAQRFPEWRERSEADLGMVLMEAMAALGDEFSYLQDRIDAEPALESATERRSLLRLARLVDYEPRPATSARTVLRLTVAGAATMLPAGIRVAATAPDGTTVPFETGNGLGDAASWPVDPAWNELAPYWWDEAERLLRPGAREVHVEGQGHGLVPGLDLLVETRDADGAAPPLRALVRLTEVEEVEDALFARKLTRLAWRAEDAPARHHDLARTRLHGNLVPATQGEARIEHVAIGHAPATEPGMPVATERLGANATAAAPRWQAFHALRHAPLAWLAAGEGAPRPEIAVTQLAQPPRPWRWVRRLLEAGPFEEAFTLDPEAWIEIGRLPDGRAAMEYDGGEGTTLRFGDGVFGEIPNDGDVFAIAYRTGLGARGNVPAGTVTAVDPAWAGTIAAATNPFAATGGAEAETDAQIRRRAPHAFRATMLRAVRPEDFDAAVARLPWVQRSGTAFRWTGSWPTIFATVDALGGDPPQPAQAAELVGLLNRIRLAGYEAYAPPPENIGLELRIEVCAAAEALAAEVLGAVIRALEPLRHADGATGFFHPDNLVLGQPFERSRLEAAVQAVPGVAGVHGITYRRRGRSLQFLPLPGRLPVAPGQVIRVDNDPNRPERGSFRVEVLGGR